MSSAVPPDRVTIAMAAALFVVLAAAVALSIAVALGDVLRGELRVLREIQGWSWLGGWFADSVRFLTTTQVVNVTGAALVVALWLAGERRAAIALAVAVALLNIVQPSLKEIIDRPRPAEDVVDVRGGITSPSFPSGHVMSPATLYGFLAGLALLRPGWPPALRLLVITASLFLLASAGFVNLYLGVHWPTDVLGGWLWGGALALAGLIAMRVWPLADQQELRREP